MKKKLLLSLLLLTLFFVTGCNKEGQNPSPTPTTAAPTETATPTPSPSPTSTPTPTPLPENLALKALQNLSASLDSFHDYFPEDIADYSKGAGYDLELDLTLGSELLQSIGYPGIDVIRLEGAIDVKDTLAAKGTLYLKDTKLITGELFTDYKTVYYNLPDYSNQYTSYPIEELSSISEEDLTEYTRVAFGNDKLDFLLTNVKLLLDCFQPLDTIETGCTIGSGSYTVTGEKHTVRASSEDLKPILNTLATDERTLDFMRDILLEFYETEFSYLQFDYYISEDGSFACALSPDFSPELPIVLVSTSAGFRFYAITEDGEKLYCYSEEPETVRFPADSAEETNTIVVYDFQENEFSLTLNSDDFYFTINYFLNGENFKYDAFIMAEHMTILIDANGTREQGNISLTLASYGIKSMDLNIKMKLRDYVEAAVPQDSVDADTWNSRFNYNALLTDFKKIYEESRI